MASEYKAFDQQLHREVLGLSSGTLATLTGLNRYDELDTVREDLAHTVRAFPHRFNSQSTWVDVWNFYYAHCPAIRETAPVQF